MGPSLLRSPPGSWSSVHRTPEHTRTQNNADATVLLTVASSLLLSEAGVGI
jgi:hypothetical protein